jgi:K+-transporting ATPase ATPase A chain
VVGGIERWTYRLLRIDPDREQGWKAYAGSLLTFSGLSAGLTFLILRFQHLPWR